ncbi:putative glycosyl transferase [compost metagenome]
MTKKVVWIICQYAAPLKYGFGSRHFYLAEEWIKQGYEVTIFTSSFNHFIHTKPVINGNYTYEKINDITVCWVKGNTYRKPSGLGRVFSWLLFSLRMLWIRVGDEVKKPDVIIVSSPSIFPIINGYLFKRKFKSKLIMEIRDIWPLTLTTIGKYPKGRPLIVVLSWLEKFAYSKSDFIVSTMPKADLHVREVVNNDFNFKCIPQGIDKEILKETQSVLNPSFEENFPKDKFIIGYAGTIGAANNLETLIETAKCFEKSGLRQFHFLILGDGYKKEELQQSAAGLSNVSFLGKVAKKDVKPFLEKCHVLYDGVKSTPLYQFGLSRNKWVDYMLSGRPIIVSYTGYVSMINEANCGLVVPAEDVEALKNALQSYLFMSNDQLNEIGLRGKKYIIENRTFDKLALSYSELFN